MPELPEVETIIQQLQQKILNKTITKVDILDDSVIQPSVVNASGQEITDVYRRAKMLVFKLKNGYSLLTSLRMTGHFRYNKSKRLHDKENYPFTVGKFYLSDGSVLSHHSIRKFGFIKLLSEKELCQELSKLGIEPLSEEFTLATFSHLLTNKKNSNIKGFLMDQNQIGGIGNIYAQEILYHARIDPGKRIIAISPQKKEKIYHEIKRVLALAITQKGTTVENYSNLEGSGHFQEELAVYNQVNCPMNHSITKIKLGGRGTSFCRKCQH